MTTLRGIAKECAGSVVASDFSVLAAYALGRTKEFIFREPDYIPTEEESEKLKNVLLRRADKEPVAYIVGEKEFFGLPFLITKDTLVPRPETEHLVEEAITLLSETVPGTVVVDLGTGSGAIAVSVAHATSDKLSREDRIRFFATDISSAALGVAKQNAKRHGADRLITFLEGNLLDPIPEDALTDTRHIVILANLPYLSHGIFESADDDVRVYEPESALVADDEGLALYLELLDDIARRKESLWPGKHVDGLFEISPEQERAFGDIFFNRFPDSHYDFLLDLSGRTRVFRFHVD